MKTLQNKLIFFLFSLFFFLNTHAQVPQKMSYQAVVRNSSNVLITSAPVGIRISILSGSASGPSIYTETQNVITNANGLVSLEIGTGTVVSGSFSLIVWNSGLFFIKTEIDPTGGTSYTINGTTQLLSVPFAFYAEKAKTTPRDCSVTSECGPGFICSGGFCIPSFPPGTNVGDMQYWNGTAWVVLPVGTTGQTLKLNASHVPTWSAVSSTVGGFTHYLGEDYLGGIIFYIYKGSDGLEHGLIVSKTESTAIWQNTGVLVNANRTEDGFYNTNLMTDSPAATYIASLGAGWYLPSIDELGLLYYNRYSAQKGLRTSGNTLLSNTITATYWSSTEYFASGSYHFTFHSGYITSGYKTDTHSVRGVKAF